MLQQAAADTTTRKKDKASPIRPLQYMQQWAGVRLAEGARFENFKKKRNVETKWENANFNGGVF